MLWGILNLLMSVLEMTFLWGSHFRFMNSNSRTIFYQKRWYVIGFTAAAIAQFTTFIIFSNGWHGVILQLIMTALLGLLLFHRKMLPLILDILFSVVLVLGMECGLFIFNLVMVHIGFQIFPNPASAGCLAMLLKILSICLLSAAMIRWKNAHSGGYLSLRQTITILVLPVFSIFFLYVMIRMQTVYVRLYGIWLVLATLIALLVLNIYFLYLFRYLFRVNRLEQEMKIIQVQNELQYRHYEELERKYRESRKILHDMKNHLQAVEQLYEDQNKQAGDNYVQDLYHMINVLGEKYYSSDHMLNIILNEKLSQAVLDGIQVKAEVGDVDFSDIKDMDMTTIFANLLDNAIEAASNSEPAHGQKHSAGTYHVETAALPESSMLPWLELKIDNIQDFRVIKIRNSFNPHSDGRDTRKDAAKGKNDTPPHMGLGLVNVRHALDKYNGSLEQSKTSKEYCITIILPGKEV